ncbi:hypothetical protein MC7420_1450 [Coleofasciculus chthonoplastes PCC 7420]|uniref:Uncharacterized protein n=1 Tax=Coleofasciculus chthonoplastes PCC 7420 TaxID=118168 RepID=B4VRV2_9CYAN|nr:hypothetical protein MC7420_1450 [Coleofasciculus chthonoplastes PCC 7420]
MKPQSRFQDAGNAEGSWVKLERWNALTTEKQKKFLFTLILWWSYFR